ncbi:MAG: hypothetical protein RR115_08650 [Hydrogenoanaerobacterium sp.]
MAEIKSNSNAGGCAANQFKEAVCINTKRIYDSCSAVQCSCYKIKNLKVFKCDR